MTAPTLLIVIPCLNEAAHLPALLGRLRADPCAANTKIVVADGGSTDASRDIVSTIAQGDPRVVLLTNDKRIQSAGVNLAVKQYGDEAPLFVRIDAHAGYPENFLRTLIDAQAESDADAVTVAMHAKAHTGRCFQVANANAQNSVLGTGGSAHRHQGERRFVDHGHHALFKTEAFLTAGGYDETFTHNEDAEFDFRLAANGGRILLAGDVLIDYYPRTTAQALWGQYYMFGRGRAKNIAKHGMKLKPRQWAPALIAPAALLAPLGMLWPVAAAPFALYLLLCLGLGAIVGLRNKKLCAVFAGIPAAIMHLAWSCGFWRQRLSQS